MLSLVICTYALLSWFTVDGRIILPSAEMVFPQLWWSDRDSDSIVFVQCIRRCWTSVNEAQYFLYKNTCLKKILIISLIFFCSYKTPPANSKTAITSNTHIWRKSHVAPIHPNQDLVVLPDRSIHPLPRDSKTAISRDYWLRY